MFSPAAGDGATGAGSPVGVVRNAARQADGVRQDAGEDPLTTVMLTLAACKVCRIVARPVGGRLQFLFSGRVTLWITRGPEMTAGLCGCFRICPARDAIMLKPRRVVAGLVVASCLALTLVAEPASSPSPEQVQAFERQVTPFLSKYCFNCHNEERERGGLRLDVFKDVAAITSARDTWESVLERLQNGDMPPRRAEQPSRPDRDRMIEWVKATLADAPCDGRPRPGRVTLRRLNRAEYDNTIRDLFGVDIRAAEDFPVDDSGYGFDNIGDVLSVSPLLMERYLAAAERVAQAVIVTPDPPPARVVRKDGARLARGREESDDDGEHRMASGGEVGAPFDFPLDGEYTVRIGAYADQAGPDPARLCLRLDGKDVGTADVKAEEGESGVYAFSVKTAQGRRRLGVDFINDYYQPDHKDPKLRGDRNLVIEYVELEAPRDRRPRSLTDAHRRIMVCSPGPSAESRRQCARKIIEGVARRAFRRPVAAEEVDRYAGLALQVLEDGGSFEQGMQLALQALLVSPSFLFLVESGPDPDRMVTDGVYRLTDHELAARLSYFLWSSMPDARLFKLADSGTLSDDAVLEAEVLRMLKDPRSRGLVENFGGQWLGLRKLEEVSPDPGRFPEFDEALRQAMSEESRRFFEHILRENRSLMEFLLADYTFVNERLARHYRFPPGAVKGDSFRKVQLGSRRPGGVLSHAAVLTLTSDPTRTSPVKRGKWVLEQLLGTPPPPPPPDVPPLEEGQAVELKETLRQRMELHQSRADCKSCHSRMDPIGFGLENYDAIGAWRDREGSFEIDSTGTLPGGETFNGPADLQKILLAQRDLFRRCLTRKMLTYALGRGVEYADRCVVETICEKLAAGDDRISVLVTEIVKSPPFRLRAMPEARP